MRLDRVFELVEEYGCSLQAAPDRCYDLYNGSGEFVGSLHDNQIDELLEDDFIEFYLED